MTNSRFYSSNAAVTSLQVTAAPSDASIQVASSTGWPGSFPFTVSLDYGSANEELVDVTGGGPSIFNVTRAVDGTSATTHNAGAVVRHVSSARDFTDSRTHEASNTGVHGISGSFVDTASTQTLSNKTLNAPTINNATETGTITATGTTRSGGTYTSSTMTSPTLNTPTVNGAALSGTLSGAPTFSGVPSFSAGLSSTDLNITGKVQATETATSNVVDASIVGGDTFDRYRRYTDGKQEWGPGSGARDATFQRTGVGQLQLSTNLLVTGAMNASSVGATSITGNPTFTGTPVFTPATIAGSSLIPDTVTNGWSLDNAQGRSAGGVTTVRLQVERVGSNISSDTKGNIPDTTVGTLAAGWRPLDGSHIVTYDVDGTSSGCATVTTGGVIILKSLYAGNTIGLSSTVIMSLTFVSAT